MKSEALRSCSLHVCVIKNGLCGDRDERTLRGSLLDVVRLSEAKPCRAEPNRTLACANFHWEYVPAGWKEICTPEIRQD